MSSVRILIADDPLIFREAVTSVLEHGLMGRIIIVISRYRTELLPELTREFGDSDVQVVVDRRRSHRRQRSGEKIEAERRQRQRRIHEIWSDVYHLGFAMVAIE